MPASNRNRHNITPSTDVALAGVRHAMRYTYMHTLSIPKKADNTLQKRMCNQLDIRFLLASFSFCTLLITALPTRPNAY